MYGGSFPWDTISFPEDIILFPRDTIFPLKSIEASQHRTWESIETSDQWEGRGKVRWKVRWMHGWMHKWMFGWSFGRTDACTHGWTDGCTDRCMHWCTDGHMHGCTGGQMDSCTDSLLEAGAHARMHRWSFGRLEIPESELDTWTPNHCQATCSKESELFSFQLYWYEMAVQCSWQFLNISTQNHLLPTTRWVRVRHSLAMLLHGNTIRNQQARSQNDLYTHIRMQPLSQNTLKYTINLPNV